jgi:hypothetical protein
LALFGRRSRQCLQALLSLPWEAEAKCCRRPCSGFKSRVFFYGCRIKDGCLKKSRRGAGKSSTLTTSLVVIDLRSVLKWTRLVPILGIGPIGCFHHRFVNLGSAAAFLRPLRSLTSHSILRRRPRQRAQYSAHRLRRLRHSLIPVANDGLP